MGGLLTALAQRCGLEATAAQLQREIAHYKTSKNNERQECRGSGLSGAFNRNPTFY